MENIKLYINASTEDVKQYLEKLIDIIIKKYPSFTEIYIKMNANTPKSNYWHLISDKLNFTSNLLLSKEKDNNKKNIYINTILFLLFGNQSNYNKLNSSIIINIEQYENSQYSNEISNFRNCLIIILIQIFINGETNEINKSNDNNNIIISDNNNNNLINIINRIVKSSYIKKSIHVIKSLLKKDINNQNDIFILTLFYFIYKKYQKYFIDFINSDNCDIKKEYKYILINEYQVFTYDDNSAINYSNKIFEIKLSYSLLGINPKNEKIKIFLKTIKDKKLKSELLEVFENFYYKNYLIKNNNDSNENKDNKNNKLLNILKEVQNIKKNVKDIKNNVEELKNTHDNYMNDILRILNIINKPK